MSERMSDRRLDAVLASIGEHLEVDEPAAFPTAHPNDHHRSRRLLAVAAVVAIVVAGTLVVAPARHAVAGWLGIGSTRIELENDQPAGADSLPSIVEDSEMIPFDKAEVALAEPLPDIPETGLGPPDGVVAAPEGGNIIVWSESNTTLWIRVADSTGSINTKVLGPDAEFRSVTGLGDDALLVTGDHLLRTPQRQVSASTVLLWINSGIGYRLESTLPEDEMIEIARAIE